MNLTSPADLFQGLGFPVSISDIDKELPRLYADEEDGSPGTTRASLLNFALYSERPDKLEENSGVIGDITRNAACRSLLVSVDSSNGPTSAKAWIQAHCQIGRNGEKSVCSEQISFVLTGGSPALVRNTVFSHLDSDLPLVFWWRGEFSDSFEDRLYSRIDRLIFDSEMWQNPRNQFLRLITAQESGRSQFCCHDLAYTRLNPLRQAISNAFDLPLLGSMVGKISWIRIQHPAANRMSALHLGAWLALSLEARLVRASSSLDRYHFQSTGSAYPPEFDVEMEETGEGELSVKMGVGDRILELKKDMRNRLLSTRIWDESMKQCEFEDCFPVRKTDDASLVTEILERGGRNRNLFKTVEVTGEMLTV